MLGMNLLLVVVENMGISARHFSEARLVPVFRSHHLSPIDSFFLANHENFEK